MYDLFDVFGGRDNLRLMCGASRFRTTREGGNISFWVGEDIIRVAKAGFYYCIMVQNRKTRQTRSIHMTHHVSVIGEKFEHFTGYVLNF